MAMGSKAKRATATASDAKKGKPSGKGPGWKPGPGRGYAHALSSDMLADMRAAYTQPIGPKTSAAVKAFRQMFMKEPGKYMALYVKLVEAEGPSPDDPLKTCEAEEGCVRAIDELLDEIGVKNEAKGESAAAAGHPRVGDGAAGGGGRSGA